MNTQGYQASQPDKEDIEDILEGPSDLRDRPHNLKEDAEQKLEQAAEKIHEVIEKIEHAGHKLQEKIENYAGFDNQKEAPKKAESGEQEETKGPQEGKKETVPNLAKNWVDKVLGAENPSLEPKVKEISQKISKKIDDFKENLHGQKEDVISNPPGKHGPETQEKHEHHIRTDFKNAFKVKGDTNIADQLSHGLHNMTNTLSNVFKTNKGSTNLKGRQGEPNDTEEQVPLVKQKPSMRKQSDAIASYNLTFKETMQGGLHSLSSMLTQGVQIAKRKLSATNEPHYVRRKSITLEEERYSRTYRVGEEFREVIAGFSKTVDEDWQDERIDELSKAGVSENPFEPFGTKDIKIPQGEEIHHEGWHNREDFGSFLSGEELVFKTQGVSSTRGESWGKGLAQRSRKDIEKLDRQLDQVISGKEDLGSTKRMGNENIESSAPKGQGDRGLSRKAEKDLEKIERKLDQAISSVPGTEMGLEETRSVEDSGRERQVKRVNQGSGSGLVGRSEQDVERLDRQLDQVISGREGEDVEEVEQEYQGFKDITNEVSERKVNKGDEGKLISKVNEGVDYNDKLLDKVIKEGGRGGLASEDKENLGGKKQLKAGNEKIRSHQAENITSASQNV